MKSYLKLNIPNPRSSQIQEFTDEQVSAHLLHRKPRPHITVYYGLPTDDPQVVARAVGDVDTVKVKLGRLGFWSDTPNLETDVILSEIYSKELRSLRRRLADALQIEYTRYVPHMILAYVEAGSGPGTTFLSMDAWERRFGKELWYLSELEFVNSKGESYIITDGRKEN